MIILMTDILNKKITMKFSYKYRSIYVSHLQYMCVVAFKPIAFYFLCKIFSIHNTEIHNTNRKTMTTVRIKNY